MDTGVKISLGGHAVLLIAAVFNGPLFQSDDDTELKVAQVSLISGSELAALEIQKGPASAAPSDPLEPVQPDPVNVETPSEPDLIPETAPNVDDTTGQTAPVDDTGEVENTQTALLAPKPTEVETPTPEQPKAPEPEVQPVVEPDPVVKEVEPVVEPKPVRPTVVTPPRPAAAPKTSIRPERRPEKKPEPEVVETPEEPKPVEEPKEVVKADPTPKVVQPTKDNKPKQKPQNLGEAPKTASGQTVEDLIAASIADEVKGSKNGGATGTASGSPLSQSDKDGLMFAIRECWNVPAGVENAENLGVTLGFELHRDGLIKGGIVMISAQNPSSPLTKVAFSAARRAIIRCLPYNNLPQDKYESWKKVEVTFNPRNMVLE